MRYEMRENAQYRQLFDNGEYEYLNEDEFVDRLNVQDEEIKDLKAILRMVKDFHLRDLDEYIQERIIKKLKEV